MNDAQPPFSPASGESTRTLREPIFLFGNFRTFNAELYVGCVIWASCMASKPSA